MKKKNRSKKNSFMKEIVNGLTVILMTAAVLFGMQVYTAHGSTLTFAQLSDVHFSTAKVNTSYRLNAESAELLEDAIDQINETPNVDFVMFTGDMINKPFRKELMAFLPYANELKPKWYAVYGNHDICIGGALSKQVYLKTLQENNANFKFKKPYYSFSPKKGYKVIALDAIIDTRLTSNGEIPKEELQWLNKELKKAQNEVVLIFMHMPIIEPLPSKSHRLLNDKEVLAVLEQYKNPIAVFTGHYHTTKITQKNNLIFVSTPSMVSYPNAFRIIKVTNDRKKVTFNIGFRETRYKDVQKRAKMLAFGSALYYGADDDREQTITIEKK